jgi:hypothetical protein
LGEIYTIDRTPPQVSSITRVQNDPVTGFSASFLITFSEPVTGVDASDFTMSTTGLVNLSITGISGGGNTRVVMINTGLHDGTVRLDLVDDDSILDLATSPLNGAGAGNGSFNGGETYTIDRPDLPAPLLRSPGADITIGDATPTFRWTGIRNAVFYEIELASDAAFTSPVHSNTGSATSYTIPTLSEGAYYWHVRGINASAQSGAWSQPRSLIIDTSGPTAPAPSSPADGSSHSRMPTVRWAPSSGAVTYEFQIDDNPTFSSPFSATGRGTARKPPYISPGTYYWHVRGRDAYGNWGSWSVPYTLTISP